MHLGRVAGHLPETGLAYRDTAVSVRGPAVADIDRAFAGVWDESGEPWPTKKSARMRSGSRPQVNNRCG